MATTAQLKAGITALNSCLSHRKTATALGLTQLTWNSGGAANINGATLGTYSVANLVAYFDNLAYQCYAELNSVYLSIYGVPYMTAIAAITINDGATTPVAHTFYPVSSTPDASYRENIAGLALVGQGTIKAAIKSDNGNGLNKVRLTIDLPALEVVTGSNSLGYSAAPKVAYSDKVNVDFILPSRGTGQQRKDLRILLTNLLANAQVIDMIENLNPSY